MHYSINLNTVAINLKNCSQQHINYFNSQFFPLSATQKPKALVTVVFKNKIVISKKAKRIEENIYVDDKTYVLDIKKNILAIDFSSLSPDNLQISVENDFDLYYLYTFFIESLFIIFGLKSGLLFVHSSSVAKNGKGYLFPAWRHTGKTQTLLNLVMHDGYAFMGDDYTVVDRGKLCVYPKKINLFSYNLKEHPTLYAYLDKKLALRLKITTKLKTFLTELSYRLPGTLGKALFRVGELAEVSTNFKTAPENLDVAVVERVQHHKTVILQASQYVLQPEKLTPEEIRFKLSETIAFELADFLNVYTASSYVSGKKLNLWITDFKKNYAALTQKYITQANMVFVDNKNEYYTKLLAKFCT